MADFPGFFIQERGDIMVSVSKDAQELIYWHKFPEYYEFEWVNDEQVFTLKPDAPERVKKSFEAWKKQKDK